MAQTYAWVVEQEFARLEKKTKKSEQWILGQQVSLDGSMPQKVKTGAKEGERVQPGVDKTLRQRMVDELMKAYEMEAKMWMKQEAEARRIAAEQERQRRARAAEETRRHHVRQRKSHERQERVRAYELEKRERARLVTEAWQAYEIRWAALPTSTEPLAFTSIPWPISSPPVNVASITPAGIVQFLFSPLHSQNQSRKERIRSAQLRWHPDRFRRLLGRVEEGEKQTVEEGVGIVARCLNDLMARETSLAQHVRT
jgi:hypothetical protein